MGTKSKEKLDIRSQTGIDLNDKNIAEKISSIADLVKRTRLFFSDGSGNVGSDRRRSRREMRGLSEKAELFRSARRVRDADDNVSAVWTDNPADEARPVSNQEGGASKRTNKIRARSLSGLF